jgi:WD40 repeat protein
MTLRRICAWLFCSLFLADLVLAADGPVAIDVPVRTRPVDFDAEILPILRSNCIACHNEKKASGGLSLESAALMVKGGEHGPAVVAGKSADSLLLKVASHQQKQVMPPPNNKVGAKSLSPTALGLIKLWIDQGASAGVPASRTVRFQPLPDGFQPAFAAAVTPDGRFAVCSRGNRLFVYNLPTAKLAATLVDPSPEGGQPSAAHRDIIRSLAFDSSGDLLASGAFREVKLWRRPHVHEIAQWPHDAPVQTVAVSADGKSAVTGDDSGRISIWDIATGKVSQTITAHQAAVTGLAFSADGSVLFSGSLDKTLCTWNVPDGKPAGKSIAVKSPLHGLAIINRGTWLVTGDADGIAHIWETAVLRGSADAKPIREIKAHQKSLTAFAAMPGADSDFLSGGADGFVRRWSAESGMQVREFDNGAAVVALAVRPDARRMASAGPDFVKLWTLDAPKPLAQLQGDPRLAAKIPRLEGASALTKALIMRTKQDLKSYEGLERAVTVRADELKKLEAELVKAQKMRDEKKTAATKAPAGDKTAIAAEKALVDAETAVAVAELTVERFKAAAKQTSDRLAAVQKELAGREELLKQQEAAKNVAAAEAKASRQPVRSLAFTSDNQRLAVGCDDGVLHLYDAETGMPSESVANHQSAVSALAVTSTGTLISSSFDRRAIVWDASNRWRLERTIGGPQHPDLLIDRVLALDFSPDGKLLASGGGASARTGELKIWNVADGRLLSTIPDAHADTIFGVRFSPDGRRLATASADRFVKIFDAASGAPLRVLTGHTAHVLGVSWKADGKLLVSCGADNVLKLWDADSGSYLRTMKGGIYGNGQYKREVAAVTFIADSEEILAASGDGSVRLHRVSSDNEVMSFTGARGYQYSVAVTADGQTLLAAGSDGILRVWLGRDSRVKHSLAP